MKNNSMLITIVAVIIVGAIAFYGGMQYQKSQRSAAFAGAAAGGVGGGRAGRFGGGAGAGGAGGGAGARPVMGQIISSDANSITVKLADGSSKIVLLSGSTPIMQSTAGTQADLQAGKNVMVFGTTNSDGSVTATNVQLNPQQRGGFGGGSSRPSASPQ